MVLEDTTTVEITTTTKETTISVVVDVVVVVVDDDTAGSLPVALFVFFQVAVSVVKRHMSRDHKNIHNK